MPYTLKRDGDTQVTLTITVPAEQVERAMRHAAEHISEDSSIPGFRPGKASYEVIKERVGEMKLLESATEEMIRASLSAALIEEDLSIVGQPYFKVEKMVPGNDFVYTAEISLMPSVTKLADYTTLSVTGESTKVSDEVMKQATKDLLRMRTNEIRAAKDYQLKSGDKAVVNMTMKRQGVVLEGGEAQNHGIYTAETYYIDGFIDKILGAKEDEEKTFSLKFPKDHYQKHLAGEDVDFTVKIKEIHTLEAPTLDEKFVSSLGFKTMEDFDKQLRTNLEEEKSEQETRRQEKAVLELLAEKSTFSQIGDLLVNQEIDKMIFELRQWVTQNGMEFDEYLKSINKSVADLKLDFAKQALIRIKVALILEDVAKKENIVPAAQEIDAEVDRIADAVAKDPASKERVYSPEYRDRIETQLRNKKTVEFLREKMVKNS